MQSKNYKSVEYPWQRLRSLTSTFLGFANSKYRPFRLSNRQWMIYWFPGIKHLVTWRDRREGPSSIQRLGPSYTIAETFSEWILADLRTWTIIKIMSSFDIQYVCRGYNYLFPRVELRWVLKRCLVSCSSTEFVENSIHSNCWSSFAINWQWALWSMFTSHRWKVPPVSTFFLLFKNMITIIKKTSSCCCRIRDC